MAQGPVRTLMDSDGPFSRKDRVWRRLSGRPVKQTIPPIAFPLEPRVCNISQFWRGVSLKGVA